MLPPLLSVCSFLRRVCVCVLDCGYCVCSMTSMEKSSLSLPQHPEATGLCMCVTAKERERDRGDNKFPTFSTRLQKKKQVRNERLQCLEVWASVWLIMTTDLTFSTYVFTWYVIIAFCSELDLNSLNINVPAAKSSDSALACTCVFLGARLVFHAGIAVWMDLVERNQSLCFMLADEALHFNHTHTRCCFESSVAVTCFSLIKFKKISSSIWNGKHNFSLSWFTLLQSVLCVTPWP